MNLKIEHMPDFDQVRDTLAVDGSGDPGGMYCVPTSLTNLLGHIGDLLELIGLFGNQPDTADLDGDGWVGVNDMLILLGNWTE
jgi:hypothetical protein